MSTLECCVRVRVRSTNVVFVGVFDLNVCSCSLNGVRVEPCSIVLKYYGNNKIFQYDFNIIWMIKYFNLIQYFNIIEIERGQPTGDNSI